LKCDDERRIEKSSTVHELHKLPPDASQTNTKKSQSRSRQQENALRSRELNDIIENKPDTLIFFLPVLKEIPKPIKSGNKIVIITGMKILRDVEQRTSMVSNYCDFHVNLSTFFI
jgi:hypothetical protein